MDNISQMHFDFKDWKECFQSYRDNIKIYGDENMQLVIGVASYVSGYWIEKRGMDLVPNDKCYTGDDVFDLEKRIIKEHSEAEEQERGVDFIT